MPHGECSLLTPHTVTAISPSQRTLLQICRHRLTRALTSIAEINIGIACSCIPIVFVHFKSLGSLSGSWFSKIRYMSGRKGSSGRGGSTDKQILDSHEIEMGPAGLPQVPKGTMTGVRSFMRNFNRTNKVHMTQTGLLSVDSLEYTYHDQLQRELRYPASRDGPPQQQP
jgi:hypothetical protein